MKNEKVEKSEEGERQTGGWIHLEIQWGGKRERERGGKKRSGEWKRKERSKYFLYFLRIDCLRKRKRERQTKKEIEKQTGKKILRKREQKIEREDCFHWICEKMYMRHLFTPASLQVSGRARNR